ncbi:MAG: Gfo/Idh/MocA family oxidoreductase [FCB group bacterium]|jgi:predicted dehydrogenase|nr:Gfo/Idh/MocA family oxidoreductase [FCB group bacterium]
MDKIRIGFVGLGGIARIRHVPGLKALEGVELVAVANRSRETTEAAAREFGIPNACDSWDELVHRDNVDAVFIGTWPYMHCPVTLAALEAGKHVFCQARMAMNFDEARQMYDRARGSGLVAGLCPAPFGLSIDSAVKRLLREGELGTIRLVRVQSFSNAFVNPDTPMTWRKDERLSGLNMHTLGMYIEVIHRWFGWTRSVFGADTQVFVPERIDLEGVRRKVKIPDQITFRATMESGFPVQYAISAAVHHGMDAIEIYGSKATLRYDVNADVLFGGTEGGAMGRVAVRPEEAYDVEHWSVERDFVAATRGEGEYRPDFDDGMRYMQVIQGVYAAAATRSEVTLQ